MKKAVIILSGGLDSACMVSYLKKGYQLYGITFAYGQRASEEIKAAKRIAKLLKLKEHKILDIGFMKELYGDSNVLTSTKKKMPSTFESVSYTHLRAHETRGNLVCRLLLEKKKHRINS